MPAPPKTTDAQIVQAARRLLEREGRDGFSMNDVAAAVGVRAPSLYGRFKDRADLLAAVELDVCADLGAAVGKAAVDGDPQASLMAQSRAVRRFAAKHPNGYSLIFDVRSVHTAAGTAARAAALGQLMPHLVALVGAEQSLLAARVLTPFLHGFVTIELANSFRLGPGLDEAFEKGVDTILQGFGHWKRV